MTEELLEKDWRSYAARACGKDAWEAMKAKEMFIDQVEENTSDEQLAYARLCVLETAEALGTFTTDDVQERYDVAFHEPRAWGAVMRDLARQGQIRSTGEYRQSKQVGCHGRPKRVWQHTHKEGGAA